MLCCHFGIDAFLVVPDSALGFAAVSNGGDVDDVSLVVKCKR